MYCYEGMGDAKWAKKHSMVIASDVNTSGKILSWLVHDVYGLDHLNDGVASPQRDSLEHDEMQSQNRISPEALVHPPNPRKGVGCGM